MYEGKKLKNKSKELNLDVQSYRDHHLEQRVQSEGSTFVWMNEWMNVWMNEWMNDWMNVWMYEWMNVWTNE